MKRRKAILEVGNTFGNITILAIIPKEERTNKYHNGVVVCSCSPDKPYNVKLSPIVLGKTTSCGCLSEAKRIQAIKKHGMYKSKVYKTLTCIKSRCYNKIFSGHRRHSSDSACVNLRENVLLPKIF